MSESAYDADRTEVRRFDNAEERWLGGDTGEDAGDGPLLAPGGK